MMAEDLDDGEFWLPPQFLSEDDLLMDFNKKSNNNNTRSGNGGGIFFGENNCGYEFPNGFGSYGPNSDLSSPVESVVSFTETESDEDEFSGLTRKLAQSTLSDVLWKVDSGLNYEKAKSWSMSRSPQSTLCNVMGCGCGCKQGSSHGSPNCPSPPPSAAALRSNEAAWNILYAAAGEVAKMRMVEETAAAGVYYPNKAHLVIPRKPSPISVPLKSPNHPNLGFHSNQSLSLHQHQANQFQQQLMMKQQKGFVSNLKAQQMAQNVRNVGNGRPLGLSPSAWPTLQQSQSQQRQPGSGMRAVFLGNPVAKRECSGTGVFLPRRVGTPIETRKKPVCSKVLIPDRIVQALNLNLEAMETTPQFQTRSNKTNAGLSHDYDAAFLKYRNNLLMAQAQQRRNIARPAPASNEVRLPQEWTY